MTSALPSVLFSTLLSTLPSSIFPVLPSALYASGKVGMTGVQKGVQK